MLPYLLVYKSHFFGTNFHFTSGRCDLYMGLTNMVCVNTLGMTWGNNNYDPHTF